jgi:hypothetical protein
MHRAVFLLTLLQFLLGSSTLGQDKAPAFAGKWSTDDVPRMTWEISFDEKTLTRHEISELHPEKAPIAVFNLDGTDSSTEVPDCYSRRTTLRLKKMESKEIVVTQIGPGCGSSTSGGMFITEIWKLTNDGNTLTIVRKFRSADPKIQIRNFENKYTFQRVKASLDR